MGEATYTDFFAWSDLDQMNNEDNIEESIVAPLANASLSVRVPAKFEDVFKILFMTLNYLA